MSNKLYKFTVLRIMPDVTRGEFFNYGIVICDPENPKDGLVKFNESPKLLEAFGMTPAGIAGLKSITSHEAKSWKDDLQTRTFADLERNTENARGMNQATGFCAVLVGDDPVIFDRFQTLESALEYLYNKFVK